MKNSNRVKFKNSVAIDAIFKETAVLLFNYYRQKIISTETLFSKKMEEKNREEIFIPHSS